MTKSKTQNGIDFFLICRLSEQLFITFDYRHSKLIKMVNCDNAKIDSMSKLGSLLQKAFML